MAAVFATTSSSRVQASSSHRKNLHCSCGSLLQVRIGLSAGLSGIKRISYTISHDSGPVLRFVDALRAVADCSHLMAREQTALSGLSIGHHTVPDAVDEEFFARTPRARHDGLGPVSMITLMMLSSSRRAERGVEKSGCRGLARILPHCSSPPYSIRAIRVGSTVHLDWRPVFASVTSLSIIAFVAPASIFAIRLVQNMLCNVAPPCLRLSP